jgi:hypothetical protein
VPSACLFVIIQPSSLYTCDCPHYVTTATSFYIAVMSWTVVPFVHIFWACISRLQRVWSLYIFFSVLHNPVCASHFSHLARPLQHIYNNTGIMRVIIFIIAFCLLTSLVDCICFTTNNNSAFFFQYHNVHILLSTSICSW